MERQDAMGRGGNGEGVGEREEKREERVRDG